MTELPYFLAKVLENPDDDAPRLVMADYLEENDYPEMGQFIRHQIRLARIEMDDPNYPAELSKMYRCGFLDGVPRIPFFDHVPEEGIRIGFRRGLIEHLDVGDKQTLDSQYSQLPVCSLKCESTVGRDDSATRIAGLFPFIREAEISFESLRDPTPIPLTMRNIFRSFGPFSKLEHLTLWIEDPEPVLDGVVEKIELPQLRSFCLNTAWFEDFGQFERETESEDASWLGPIEGLAQKGFPNSPIEEFHWLTREDIDYWPEGDRYGWHGPSIESILVLERAKNLKRLGLVSELEMHGSMSWVTPCAVWNTAVPESFDSLSAYYSDLGTLPQSTKEQIRHLKAYQSGGAFRASIQFPNLESLSLFSGDMVGKGGTPESPFLGIDASPRHLETTIPLSSIYGCDYSRVLTLDAIGKEEDWEIILANDWPELRRLRINLPKNPNVLEKFLSFKGMPNLVIFEEGIEISSSLELLAEAKNFPLLSLIIDKKSNYGQIDSEDCFVLKDGKRNRSRGGLDFSSENPIVRFYNRFNFIH